MFMKVIKRNQIIIFVGALMLIVAGYLNFSDNGLPINNLVPTSTLADAEEMASIGDAKLVSANVVDGEQENEIQDIVNNNDLNDSVIETNTEADIKNNDKNVSENITESSMIAENLIKVKGFEDLIIFINGENVSVIVKSDKLEEKEIAQIQNIVTRELGVKIENINISNK